MKQPIILRSIKPGERISTIAVPTVLVSYNWPAGTDRYRRVARFTDYLFTRLDKLQVPGFDPNWKTINLGATVPGLTRFPAAQEWLQAPGAPRRRRNNEDRHDLLAFAFASASADALAQGAGDAMERLRACSLLAPAERLDCLDKLSRDIAPPSPARPAASPAPEVAPAADNWIVSETTSPLDYTPVAIATALSSAGPDGAILQLSIQCRGGRTDLVITGPALTGRGEDYCRLLRRQ